MIQTRAKIIKPEFKSDINDVTSDDIPLSEGTGDEILKSAPSSERFTSNFKSGDECRSDYYKNRAIFWKVMQYTAPIAIGAIIALFGIYIAYYARPIASIEADVSNLKDQNKELKNNLESIKDTNTKNSIQLDNIEKSLNK